ncbi:hypothetical protein HY634_01525 [Candidatus Uhrbacteria bacterium]|nr:hypothetical protein [Candidatus Uhrbacteria bacterium]
MDAHAIRTWFDLLDWPLTPAEIPASSFSAQGGSASGGQIPDSWITEGFIRAPGCARLEGVRQRKAILAWRKLKKARRWVRVLRFVPSIRMIAIGNALGYGNCSDESDIDLVIVTTPKRVWFVRFCVVVLLRLFRQRPGEHTRDAICPSFFLTTEAMNLEGLQLPDSRFQIPDSQTPPDPYLLFWLTQLTVLFDRGGTYAAFWHANEQWVRRWLPDERARAVHPRIAVVSCESSVVRCWIEWAWSSGIGDVFERWSRRYQERRFSPEIRALANRDSRVVVNDRMLKFHTNDRRQEYRDRWIEMLGG